MHFPRTSKLVFFNGFSLQEAASSIMSLWWIFVGFLIISSAQAYADDEWLDDSDTDGEFIHPSNVDVQQAKTDYDRVVSYTKLPHYGTCWSNAVKSLHTSCKSLTEDVQTRLAIRFANCFLEKSGQKTFPCHDSENVMDCVKRAQIEANFFQSYLQFFTHTQNICFYLASEEWQRRAETQVNRLMEASHSVSNQLEESKNVQTQILDSQKTALVSSEALVAYNERLNESLTLSQLALVSNFREMQRSASETKMWIGDIADRISRLQSIFIDEFTGFYSLIFYILSGTFCFVLTSTNRTSGARLWLFLFLIATFFLERFRNQQQLAYFEEEPGGMPNSTFVTQVLNEEAWIIRKCFWAIASALLIYFGYNYEDLNLANQRLIMDLQKDFGYIKNFLEKIQPPAIGANVNTFSRLDGLHGNDFSDGIQQEESIPDKIRNYANRFRRSVTPSFMENGESTSNGTGTLFTVLEEEEDIRQDRESTPIRQHRRSREVTPLNDDRLTPGRMVLRSSVQRESPARTPSISTPNFSNKRLGRRALREPTPEETRDGLQQLSDITNQTRAQLHEVFHRNGAGEDLAD